MNFTLVNQLTNHIPLIYYVVHHYNEYVHTSVGQFSYGDLVSILVFNPIFRLRITMYHI